MLKQLDEDYHQMELEELFQVDVKPNLFAVSRIFAEARKQMNLKEYKTFTYALSQISWKEDCPDVFYLDKKTVAEICGIHSDTDHLSQDLMDEIGEMPIHSFLKFKDKDNDLYVNGCFVNTIASFKNRIRIRLNQDYLGLFGNLDKDYITMWSADIYKMHSERAIKFYELLRENSDTRLDTQEGIVGVRAIKELFDIPKEAYMREKGGFDRTNFEKYIIDPICEDLCKTEMITLIMQGGKFYEKVKKGGRVVGYRFLWNLSSRPQVATAKELESIKQRIEKNPEVEKVAKDLINGKKKSKSKKKDTNFTEREYDRDNLERELFLRSQGE